MRSNMVAANSLRQLLRTPVKTFVFLVLLILAVAFFMLGYNLWAVAKENIDKIESTYMTIGTVQQKATAVGTGERWDAGTKKYTYYQHPEYDGMIPVSVLNFEGADYILAPEKRPSYGAYMFGFEMSEMPLWEVSFDLGLIVIEMEPLEDCMTGDPVRVKVKRVLYGLLPDFIDEIWFCDHFNDTPEPLYANKTYVVCLQEDIPHEGMSGYVYSGYAYSGYAYMPVGSINSTQFDKNGNRIEDTTTVRVPWDEVTDGFYETPRGKRWLALIEGFDWMKYTIPVVQTNGTNLLMAFYEGNAWICDGQDITDEEYKNGDKVCLVNKYFADNNHLKVGDSLSLPLYFSDYYQTYRIGGSLINAKGELYPIFEESSYKIVGIYNTVTTSIYEITGYEMGENTVIIPSASVKNSDENNISAMGPMMGYTTSFQIPNGHIDEYMAAWEKQGISSLEINFYDKGYTKIKAGLDDMMNTATILLIAGTVTTLLVLVLFCHLFITKQKKRTAIERSLGMSKKRCVASLLTGILAIVIPACLIGSAISYWLSGYAAEQMTTAHSQEAYDTTFSDWVNNADQSTESDLMVSIDSSIGRAFIGTWVIPAALFIALLNIRGNLKSEPLKLLGERER